MRIRYTCILLMLVFIHLIFGQVPEKWTKMMGSAYTENHSYFFLQRVCDEAGGRLVGTPENEKALNILEEELKQLGITPIREPFSLPVWIRGDDRIEITLPINRQIKAVALGYSPTTPSFTADVVDGGVGYAEIFDSMNVQNKIVLISEGKRGGKPVPLRYQIIDMAAKNGAKAVLFVNNKAGNMVRAGTSNFQGKPAAVPAFSITFEEGERIKRLLTRSIPVSMKIEVNSKNKPGTSSNVIVRFPGKTKKKIVLGAHFDSWDLGQGAIDNGIGSAILFDVARLMKQFSPNNYYTIELVWFNGEELGLWGSKAYMETHRDDDILLMMNMDMTGLVYGFDIMGFLEGKDYFTALANKMASMDISNDIAEYPWTNSDHMPFMFQGIPCLTFRATLDKEMSRYYHAMGDTFDKVKKQYLSHSAGIIAIITHQLANEKKFPFRKYSPEEVKQMMEKFGIDKRLKQQGEWPFSEN